MYWCDILHLYFFQWYFHFPQEVGNHIEVGVTGLHLKACCVHIEEKAVQDRILGGFSFDRPPQAAVGLFPSRHANSPFILT